MIVIMIDTFSSIGTSASRRRDPEDLSLGPANLQELRHMRDNMVKELEEGQALRTLPHATGTRLGTRLGMIFSIF